MGAIHHDRLGEAQFFQSGLTGLNMLWGIVGAAATASQNHMAVCIPLCLNNADLSGRADTQKAMRAGHRFQDAAGRAEIEVLMGDVTAILDPLRNGRFIVFHDAYQYFEQDFNFPASGALSISDASDPSPARIAEIRDRIAEQGVDCVLAEPQFNPGLIATVLDGTDAQTGILDPIGSDLEPGSALYPEMIRNLAKALASCM